MEPHEGHTRTAAPPATEPPGLSASDLVAPTTHERLTTLLIARMTGAFSGRAAKARIVQQVGLYFALAMLIIYFAFSTQYFWEITNFKNLILAVAVIGILALGETLVIVAGGIDLSIASIVAVAGVAAGDVALNAHTGAILPLLAGMGVGVGIGFVNGFLIAVTGIPPFIVTLGTLTAAGGVALLLTGGQVISGFNNQFIALGGNLGGFPVPIMILIVLLLITLFVQQQTKFGRYIFAIGGNRSAARLFRIPVRLVEISLYTVSGLLAGIGGVTLAAWVASGSPVAGSDYELTAISAVIIGGTSLSGGEGGVQKTVGGILLIGVIDDGLNLMGVQSYIQQIVSGVIIVIAVLFDRWARANIR